MKRPIWSDHLDDHGQLAHAGTRRSRHESGLSAKSITL